MSASAATQQPTDVREDGSGGLTGLVLQATYTLGACIGQGGMGEVYEATHARLPGRFAVKILRPHLLANEDAFRRFCREAEIMSALRHPHIIQIFDFNTSLDGMPYFVMEFLEGVDLEARLARSGAVPLPALVRIVDAVASALGAAHALGIVHRDLKPSNIFLIRGEGQDNDFVKVLDFGISKAAGTGPRLSKALEIMGTPEFMAPEQALGLVSQIDARTDQFGLAAISYAMLTGRGPFTGDDPASLLYQVVHEQPLPISGFVPWQTREVQLVLDRALSKRPADRFDNIVEFAGALADAVHAVLRGTAPVTVVPGPSSAESDTSDAPAPPKRVRTLRPVPRAPLPQAPLPLPPLPRRLEAWPQPEADLPRRLDHVPHGPARVVVLGLAVLGLAGIIFHNGWYRGLARQAANLHRDAASLVRRDWRRPPPSVPLRAPVVVQIVTAPREAPAPAAALSARDEPPAAQTASPQTPRPRPGRLAKRHRTLSRSGWQTIELPYHAPSSTSEAEAGPDDTMPMP